jgi:hypothetical protein
MTPEQRLQALQSLATTLTQRMGKVVVAVVGPVSPSLQDVTVVTCIASLGMFEASVGVYEESAKERLPAAVRGDLIRKLRGIARALEDG